MVNGQVQFTPGGLISTDPQQVFRPRDREPGVGDPGGVSTIDDPTPSAEDLFGTAEQREAQIEAFRRGGREELLREQSRIRAGIEQTEENRRRTEELQRQARERQERAEARITQAQRERMERVALSDVERRLVAVEEGRVTKSKSRFLDKEITKETAPEIRAALEAARAPSVEIPREDIEKQEVVAFQPVDVSEELLRPDVTRPGTISVSPGIPASAFVAPSVRDVRPAQLSRFEDIAFKEAFAGEKIPEEKISPAGFLDIKFAEASQRIGKRVEEIFPESELKTELKSVQVGGLSASELAKFGFFAPAFLTTQEATGLAIRTGQITPVVETRGVVNVIKTDVDGVSKVLVRTRSETGGLTVEGVSQQVAKDLPDDLVVSVGKGAAVRKLKGGKIQADLFDIAGAGKTTAAARKVIRGKEISISKEIGKGIEAQSISRETGKVIFRRGLGPSLGRTGQPLTQQSFKFSDRITGVLAKSNIDENILGFLGTTRPATTLVTRGGVSKRLGDLNINLIIRRGGDRVVDLGKISIGREGFLSGAGLRSQVGQGLLFETGRLTGKEATRGTIAGITTARAVERQVQKIVVKQVSGVKLPKILPTPPQVKETPQITQQIKTPRTVTSVTQPSTVIKDRINTGILPSQAQAPRQQERQKTALRTKTEQKARQRLRTGLAVGQVSEQKQEQKLRSALRLRQLGRGRQRGRAVPIKIKVDVPTTKGGLPFAFGSKARGLGEGRGLFGVEVRRFGTFRPVGRGRLRQAIATGKGIVTRGLGATFRITPITGGIRRGEVRAPIGFRRGKPGEGLTFVERPRFRLSTTGEVKEIQRAKRRKKKKKK